MSPKCHQVLCSTGPPAPPFHAQRPPLSGGLRRPPARAPLLCPFSGSGVPIRAWWQTMERVAPGGFALASASAEPGAPLKRPQLSAPLSLSWCRRELPWRLLPLASQGEAGFGRWLLVSSSGRGAWGTSGGVEEVTSASLPRSGAWGQVTGHPVATAAVSTQSCLSPCSPETRVFEEFLVRGWPTGRGDRRVWTRGAGWGPRRAPMANSFSKQLSVCS